MSERGETSETSNTQPMSTKLLERHDVETLKETS
jgi:hypothetical protein